MGIQLIIGPAKSIKGWMSEQELLFLAKIARESKNIVEIGCYYGRSTRVLADNCRDGLVYAIDPWRGPYYKTDGKVLFEMTDSHYNGFVQNTKDCNNIIICRGTFDFYVNKLPKMDFVFIDGDHRYDVVKSDINNALKILRPGAILAGHDYTHNDWPGVKQAVDELLGQTSHIDSIWWKVV